MQLQSKLGELMKSRGLTIMSLAADTGLNPGTISRFRRGGFAMLDCHTATTLCQYFNLKSISELVELSER